jgi:ketosteroid isomerase-like protein
MMRLKSMVLQHIRVCALAIAPVLVTVGAPSTLAQSRLAAQSDENAIRALETRRGTALVKADTQTLSQMVADDFVEVTRLGQLRTKAENMADIASGALKLTSVKYEDTNIKVYGDVAVLIGVADNVGAFRGIPFSGKVRYTRVFVRRTTGWQAVAMQQTSIP